MAGAGWYPVGAGVVVKVMVVGATAEVAATVVAAGVVTAEAATAEVARQRTWHPTRFAVHQGLVLSAEAQS